MTNSNDDYIQSVIDSCTNVGSISNNILSELLVQKQELEIELAAYKKELDIANLIIAASERQMSILADKICEFIQTTSGASEGEEGEGKKAEGDRGV